MEIKNIQQLPIRFDDLWGKIETTDILPTYTPKKVSEQIVIYVSGETYRLYLYDFKNNMWRYVTLT